MDAKQSPIFELEDRAIDETVHLGPSDVERFFGIELDYVLWCIDCDGYFQQGEWVLTRA